MKQKFNLIRLVLVIMFVNLHLMACADNDKIIKFEQMPATAQQFVNKHFAGKKVALVKMDNEIVSRDYELYFDNGSKIEFDRKGNWTDIECVNGAVPGAVVPAAISKYVNQNYPGVSIIKIDRDRRGYEIKLSNRMEIEFNKRMQVVDIDM